MTGPGARAAVASMAWCARGALLWLGVRAIASVMLALAGANPMQPSLARALLMVVLTVVASFAQTARHREWALLGNLGITPAALAVAFALPATVGELALALLGSVRR